MTAHVRNGGDEHLAEVATGDGPARAVAIPPREDRPGPGISGGELLLLALATCYGNDVYREAAKRDLPIDAVEVTAEADFPAPGSPASAVRYSARVTSPAPESEVRALLLYTDTVAEIQATLRVSIPVEVGNLEVVSS